jgi:type IV pilus biogenesis protein PilP
MQNKHLLLPLLLAVAGLPRIGLSNPEGISVGELSAVQSETALYKAQAERSKALSDIAGGGTRAAATPAYTYDQARMGSGSEESLPVVKLVYGSSGALRATLLYSNGIEVDAAAGQELPGGLKVVTVSLDNVVLSRSGKTFPLGFSARAPQASSTGSIGRMQAPGMPGMQQPSIMSPVLP